MKILRLPCIEVAKYGVQFYSLGDTLFGIMVLNCSQQPQLQLQCKGFFTHYDHICSCIGRIFLQFFIMSWIDEIATVTIESMTAIQNHAWN